MTTEPVRVLNLFTIMNRGGAETMVMNYYRNIDRSKVQYDFMVHRQERGAYDDEIIQLLYHFKGRCDLSCKPKECPVKCVLFRFCRQLNAPVLSV